MLPGRTAGRHRSRGLATRVAPPSRTLARLLAAALALLLLVVLVRTAWHADDAFITHRVADNLLHGLGARWNPDERVQVYTHPAWLLVSVLCQAVAGEAWLSVLVVSIATSLAAFALLARVAPAPAAALALLALSASRAVMDYGASGLENPLLYLLVVLLASPRGPGTTALLAAALALTRPDAFLLALPAWALALRRAPGRALAGLLPLLAWGGFALVYYGTPLPNTAYAKLDLAIPAGALARQGGWYLLETARHDPVTAGLLALGLALGLRRPATRPLALGLGLYLLYVVRIGGDFMAGRLLAAPAVLAAAILARLGRPPRPAAIAAALALYGLLWPASRWRAGPEDGVGATRADIEDAHGIIDERAYYQPSTGLVRILRDRARIRAAGLPIPPFRGAVLGLQARAGPPVQAQTAVGYFGYFAGPGVHVVDVYGLADPLLARIPFVPDGAWRPGHYRRPLPDGYLETLATGENRLADPALAEAWEAVRLATRAPLLAPGRWRAILALNTGRFGEAFAAAARPAPSGLPQRRNSAASPGPSGSTSAGSTPGTSP